MFVGENLLGGVLKHRLLSLLPGFYSVPLTNPPPPLSQPLMHMSPKFGNPWSVIPKSLSERKHAAARSSGRKMYGCEEDGSGP